MVQGFCSSFPLLFALVVNKEVTVANVWDASGDLGVGTPVSLDPLMIES